MTATMITVSHLPACSAASCVCSNKLTPSASCFNIFSKLDKPTRSVVLMTADEVAAKVSDAEWSLLDMPTLEDDDAEWEPVNFDKNAYNHYGDGEVYDYELVDVEESGRAMISGPEECLLEDRERNFVRAMLTKHRKERLRKGLKKALKKHGFA